MPLASVLRVRDCGIHTRNCRHRLIYRSRCHPRLERLVRGRNVSAYQVRWAPAAGMGLYVDVHYKPQPGVPGRGRGGGQSRRGEYWDWQGPASIHLQPRRILIRQTDDDLVAGLIEHPPRRTYTDNTLFTGLLTAGAEQAGLTYEYLLGYLNAEAVNDVFQYLSQERGRAQAQVKIGQVRWLPLRIPSPEAVRRVTREVRRVLEALEQGDGSGADRYRRRIDRHFADAVMSPVR